MKKLLISLCILTLAVGVMLARPSCGHTHTPMTLNVERVPATCTSRGVVDVVVTCIDCGEEISRTPSSSDKLPHEASDWMIDVESTCNVNGTQHKECKDCHEILETAKAPLSENHTPVIDPAIDPTDTTDGCTEGSHCSECGEVIVPRELIPANLQGLTVKSLSGALMVLDEEHPEKLYYSASNEVEIFSFLQDILVAKGATYVLSTDIGCVSTIPSKTVKLNVGTNIFYLLVTNKGESMLYYITIDRRA